MAYQVRDREFKQKMLEEYSTGKIKQNDLCKKYGVNTSTFYSWVKKAKNGTLFEDNKTKVNSFLNNSEDEVFLGVKAGLQLLDDINLRLINLETKIEELKGLAK